MTDEDGFLAKLAESPLDDTTRLVYADWLEEQGDEPSVTKAKFVRLVCEWYANLDRKMRAVLCAHKIKALRARLEPGWAATIEGPALHAALSTAAPRMPPVHPVDDHLIRAGDDPPSPVVSAARGPYPFPTVWPDPEPFSGKRKRSWKETRKRKHRQ